MYSTPLHSTMASRRFGGEERSVSTVKLCIHDLRVNYLFICMPNLHIGNVDMQGPDTKGVGHGLGGKPHQNIEMHYKGKKIKKRNNLNYTSPLHKWLDKWKYHARR